jgi:hypothetical protein
MDGQEFLAQAKKRAGSQKKKHLPKRAGKPAHMARRAASWKRGEARKAKRRAQNEANHQANLKRGYTRRHALRHGLPL